MAAQTYGFTPVIGFGWTDGAGNPDLDSTGDPTDSWLNAETRDDFLTMVTHFVQAWPVPYLFLGNETNVYWLTHSQAEWDAWISEYEACYDAIKAVRPATVVYTCFQLERMKGLGQHAGWSDPPHFQLVDDLFASHKADAVGFTSYPYLEYDDPASIPSDYYDEIAAHWSDPVIFTEIGWLAAPSPPYPGSEADQAAFVPRFFDLTRT